VLGSGFSAVDDPSTTQLVLFGGIDSYDTTWLWDGHRWVLAQPIVSPPGRFGAAAAYDPRSGVVLLYGGRLGPGGVVDDTWAWDRSVWRELDTGTGSPPAGEGSVLAWDDNLNEMILVNSEGGAGGQTWIWNGAQWTQLSGDLPSGTFVVSMAVDPRSRALLAASCCAPGPNSTSMWAWNGTRWHPIPTRAQPGFTAEMAPDPLGGRILLFSDPSLAGGRDMWSWTGGDWMCWRERGFRCFPRRR
jgi:hypothetical protein